MKRLCAALAVVLQVSAWTAANAAQVGPTLAEMAAMHAAMQQHVDRQAIDGKLLYLDHASGAVRTLYPVTAHPMILAMQPYYVLCFDFRDEQGRDVPVDYYMARNGGGYSVFHTAVADRGLLARLMESGRVQRLP